METSQRYYQKRHRYTYTYTHTHAPAHPRTHSRLIVLGVKKGQEGVASESRDRTVLFVRAWRTLLGIGTRRRFRLTDATYRWWRPTPKNEHRCRPLRW